jgi:hypothetical protein
MDRHVYRFQKLIYCSKNKTNDKVYICQKRYTQKCPGKIIISSKGAVVEQNAHVCSGKKEPVERF